jgi:hypothetical protein
MEQEQAARIMDVSRRGFWGDLQGARRVIADALVGGKAIKIEGGSYKIGRTRKSECPNRHYEGDLSRTGLHGSRPRRGRMESRKNEERDMKKRNEERE